MVSVSPSVSILISSLPYDGVCLYCCICHYLKILLIEWDGLNFKKYTKHLQHIDMCCSCLYLLTVSHVRDARVMSLI